MLRLLAAVWRDPALRVVAGGTLLFGAFASSLGIHQSLLAVEVFGERGRHARSAVGVAALPGGVAVEVEAILELGE